MALVKAKHKVFGVVEVPQRTVDLWPEEYVQISDKKAEQIEAEDRRALLEKLTADELRAQLETLGEPTEGKKADLIDRLLK